MTHGVWCEGEQTRGGHWGSCGGLVVNRGSECIRRRAWGGSPAPPSEGGASGAGPAVGDFPLSSRSGGSGRTLLDRGVVKVDKR